MANTNDTLQLNRQIMELGEKYWQQMQGEMPSLFDRQYWQGQLLDWVMNDESFKVDAFRFVDVLPALQSTAAIASHVRDYLLGTDRKLPVLVRSALTMAAGGISSPVATRAIRANVIRMARRFICETDSAKSIKILEELATENLTFTADILGEATTSDAESDSYLQKYQDLITTMARSAGKWPIIPILHHSASGPLPKVNISVKISALDPWLDPADHQGSVARLKERLIPLLRHARKHKVFINFDLEQWACHDITYDLFEQVALHPDLLDWPHLGLVIQAYLKTSDADCHRLLELSKRRGTPFTVRLVKGAYWDYEVVHARQNGFVCPVFTNKGRTDASYEHLTDILLTNHELVTPAFASHNLRSLVHALVTAKNRGLPKNCLEVQMLYGMAEPQRRVLSRNGYRVRIYAPIGELLPGMAYLVRRLLENTSNAGFLRQSYHEGVAISTMLTPPAAGPELPDNRRNRPGELDSPFINVNMLDFNEQSVRNSFATTLETVKATFPLQVPVVVGGKTISTEKETRRFSPNDPALLVAQTTMATTAMAQEALDIAQKSFPVWRDQPLKKRAYLLDNLADILEKDRLHLAALQVYEVGKPWREADGDVAEAIDFCRYYAHQAMRELGPTGQGDMAGEKNVLHHEGRGPTVVIAPWNFPLAILCGMTTAALVAGNTVLIKPATASTAIAHGFYHRLMQAGFPPEVVHFLPGAGATIGNYLVEHRQISQIAFTGSKEVGLAIIEKAGKTLPGQPEVKRVVCEMGGKNAVIVDDDADLDAAVKGVIHSTFGYAGQKCSACSRLILVGDIHKKLVPRLLAACESLPMTSATDPGCRLGPVIDQTAHERLGQLITDPPAGAKLLFLGDTPTPGFFIPPAIFEVKEADHPMLQQEFFGPILTLIRAKNFQAALDITNAGEFALTGSVFSRSPRNMEAARNQFKVGNLYINRGCTGALVGRQPFGGFAMSGIGTKAGGPGYLLNFANPRCITENTMRSGFTPDLQM